MRLEGEKRHYSQKHFNERAWRECPAPQCQAEYRAWRVERAAWEQEHHHYEHEIWRGQMLLRQEEIERQRVVRERIRAQKVEQSKLTSAKRRAAFERRTARLVGATQYDRYRICIGKCIRHRRMELGLSLWKVAHISRIRNRATIRNIEHGHKVYVTIDEFSRLAQALDVSASWILARIFDDEATRRGAELFMELAS